MADGCLGHLTSPHTGSEHPKNRARSISQRVIGTKEEPRLREVVARLRIAASFAFRSMRCPREDASGARELTRGRDKTQIGVFVSVRNSFGVCFHGLGRFLNGGRFRVGACLSVGLAEAGGTNNYVEGVGSANVNALHDGFKNAPQLLLAALKQSGSVDVPVERGAAANLVFLDDLLRVAPADEVGFDGIARC